MEVYPDLNPRSTSLSSYVTVHGVEPSPLQGLVCKHLLEPRHWRLYVRLLARNCSTSESCYCIYYDVYLPWLSCDYTRISCVLN